MFEWKWKEVDYKVAVELRKRDPRCLNEMLSQEKRSCQRHKCQINASIANISRSRKTFAALADRKRFLWFFSEIFFILKARTASLQKICCNTQSSENLYWLNTKCGMKTPFCCDSVGSAKKSDSNLVSNEHKPLESVDETNPWSFESLFLYELDEILKRYWNE